MVDIDIYNVYINKKYESFITLKKDWTCKQVRGKALVFHAYITCYNFNLYMYMYTSQICIHNYIYTFTWAKMTDNRNGKIVHVQFIISK